MLDYLNATMIQRELMMEGSCNATHAAALLSFEGLRRGHGLTSIEDLGNFSLLDLGGGPLFVSTAPNVTGHYGGNHITVAGKATFGAGPSRPVAIRIIKALQDDPTVSGKRACTKSSHTPGVADVALSLAHLRAWPSLIAAGCCPWPVRASSGANGVGRLYLSVRPLLRPINIHPGLARTFTLCDAHGWSDRACALNFLHSSMASFGKLLETPPRVQLRPAEFFLPRMKDLHGNASINRLFLNQYCQDPSDGTIMICDTDQVALEGHGPAYMAPGPATIPPSAVGWANLKNTTFLVDPVHAMLQTLITTKTCRYVTTLVPELRVLAHEVEMRHMRLQARSPGALQLHFNSARTWLPATPVS